MSKSKALRIRSIEEVPRPLAGLFSRTSTHAHNNIRCVPSLIPGAARAKHSGTLLFASLAASLSFLVSSCAIEPPLHLHEDITFNWDDAPLIDLNIDVIWDYKVDYDYDYNWQDYWIYGWDETDMTQFGPIGYTEPHTFNIYRYYTNWTPKGKHLTAPYRSQINGNVFTAQYMYGYYDLLVWNEPDETDGAQNTRIEEVGYDYVRAYTGPTMYSTLHPSPFSKSAYNQPEALFSAYEQAIEIPDPGSDYSQHGFIWDVERDRWVKTLNTTLLPVTYIYLVQVVLVNNKGRVTAIDGNANLTGMAHDVNMNSRITGTNSIADYYLMRLKKNRDHHIALSGSYPNKFATYIGKTNPSTGAAVPVTYTDEPVDVIGGKVMTFGICGLDPVSFSSRSTSAYAESVKRINELDIAPHYIELPFQFFNGESRTYSFDVTDQVRNLYKGGVITIVIDVEYLSIPEPPGPNSGFNAEVKDMEQELHEFDM